MKNEQRSSVNLRYAMIVPTTTINPALDKNLATYRQIATTPIKDLVGQVSTEGHRLLTFEPTQNLLTVISYLFKGSEIWKLLCSSLFNDLFGQKAFTGPWWNNGMITQAFLHLSCCPKRTSLTSSQPTWTTSSLDPR